ncbi:hypothetical protein ACI65C_004728 [Semiaphis heraclei]
MEYLGFSIITVLVIVTSIVALPNNDGYIELRPWSAEDVEIHKNKISPLIPLLDNYVDNENYCNINNDHLLDDAVVDIQKDNIYFSTSSSSSEEITFTNDLANNLQKNAESTENILQELHKWSIEYKINHNALKSLLTILRKTPTFKTLPKDPRTFLMTPKMTLMRTVTPGLYISIVIHYIMDAPGWYVVKFLEENSVEAVPCNWFKDYSNCFWPPYNKLKTAEAIKCRETPSKSWKLFKLKILSKKKITDYFVAMSKANYAQYESDISSGAENIISKNTASLPLKRIRRPNFKLLEEDTSNDSAEECESNKKIKVPSFPTFSLTDNLLNDTDEILNIELNNEQAMSGITLDLNLSNDNLNVCNQEHLAVDYQTIEHIDSMEELQKYIDTIIDKWQRDTSRLLITMSLHQKEQLNYLQNIQMMVNNINTMPTDVDNCTTKNEEDIIYSKFPATSLDVLNKLDNEVKVLKSTKIDVYNALVKNMTLIGGTSLGELLRRILKKIMTDEVAEEFSWFGRQKKFSFATTGLADLIKSAVKIKYPDQSDKDIEVIAGTWLAKAKERKKKIITSTNDDNNTK